MTAVEWLAEQLYPAITLNSKIIDSFVGVAKEMEKQQIIDAYKFGLSDEYVIGSDKYYTSTYGSKGSDETSKDVEITICEKLTIDNFLKSFD